MARIALLGLAATALLAPAAQAATVELSYEPPVPGIEPDAAYTLMVRADAGETNRLGVSGDAAGYSVADFATPLLAGDGCEAISGNEVRCLTPLEAADRSVFVDAGDLDDLVAMGELAPPARVELRGGAGKDVLRGASGDEFLRGGPGRDVLVGGDGDDRLDGGGGDDLIAGGPGTDVASYGTRTSPVTVDLAKHSGGTRGESDALYEIEGAVGGRADDSLAGDGGPNTLLAGAGDAGARDRLSGRGGDDSLTGYQVRGGSGDDGLDGRVVDCGSGTDTIRRGRFRTRGPYPRACERAIAYFFLITELQPVEMSRRSMRFAFWCVPPRCDFTLELRDSDGLLGRRRYRGPESAVQAEPILVTVGVPLRRRGRDVVTLRVIAERPYRDHFKVRLR